MEPIQLELPTVFGMKTVNAYLFLTPEPTLIDCGEQNDLVWVALEQKLAEYKLGLKDIRRVVITHGHVDHIGMAGKLANEFGTTIWVNEYTYPVAIQPVEVFNERRKIVLGFLDKLGHDKHSPFTQTYSKTIQFFHKSWHPIPKELVHTFPIDGSLFLGGQEWQVLYAPGHAVDQTCFYQADNQWLLSADMLLNITPTPIVGLNPKAPDERVKALDMMLESFEKFSKLEVSKVFPGHYQIFDNHRAMIASQVARIHQRIEECFEWIATGVQDFFELLNKLYKGRVSPPAFFMLIGYLDSLIAEGRVVMRKENGKMGYFRR